MSIQNVTVLGAGVLGSQIAYQTALKGFQVTTFNRHPAKAEQRIAALWPSYAHDLQLTRADFDAGVHRITFSDDLATAVKDADLIIEAMPEDLDLKKQLLGQVNQLAKPAAIIASNSSSFMPSQLAAASGRPQRYLHLHFANQIWVRNTAEIVGTPQTDPAVMAEVVNFAKKIGMLPVLLHKEQPGYVLNALLIPWLNSALVTWAKEVASPQTVDRTWMRDLSAPIGPFGILDLVGLRTPYHLIENQLAQQPDPDLQLVLTKLKDRIAQGQLGAESGQGFYEWPDPAFMQPDFFDYPN